MNNCPFLRKPYIGTTIAGLLMTIMYLVLQDYIAVPWNDEICTADTEINVVLYGRWDSHVWHYTYNPLHAFLLIGWLKIFGISHVSVCNINVLFASITFFLLENELIKNSLLSKTRTKVSFVLLFWLGFMLSSIITKGRIDMLAMLCAVGLYIEILKRRKGIIYYVQLFLWSFALMLSSIYVIPLVIFTGVLFIFVDFDNQGRNTWFLKYLMIGVGLVISFFSVCCFYWSIDFLYHFLNTFIRFNKNMVAEITMTQRIAEGYLSDIPAIMLCLATWIILIFSHKLSRSIVIVLTFISLIPLIMTLVGRYQPYYVWMFELPVSLLLVYIMEKNENTLTIQAGIGLIVLVSLLRPSYWVYKRPLEYKERRSVERYIASQHEVLKKSKSIYFKDADCYYPLLTYRTNLYYLYYDNIYVSDIIRNFFFNVPLMKGYEERQPDDYLAKEGVMLLTPKSNQKYFLDELLSKGYEYSIINDNDGFSLTKFKKRK